MANGETKRRDPTETILAGVRAVAEMREAPLLVVFYPGDASIVEENVEHLYLALRDTAKLSREKPLPQLDVLLQTYGGDPVQAYRMSQVIQDYAAEVTYLVPEYAYSGGTLMCLGGDEILLGDLAVLSPIDITLVSHSEDDDDEEMFPEEVASDSSVELTAINHFIRVARDARIELEKEFRRRGWRTSTTDVESSLLCEMTRQVGVLKIAKYYREQMVTYEYAKELLASRMFGRSRMAMKHVNSILRFLVMDAPSHEFPLDLAFCRTLGLNVREMGEALSQTTVTLARELAKSSRNDDLFPHGRRWRRPFIHYQPIPLNNQKETASVDSTEDDAQQPGTREETGNGHRDVSLAGAATASD